MSTEFVSTLTGDVGFVRFGRTAPDGSRTSFEFGTVSNWELVRSWVAAGDTFEPLGSTEELDFSSVDTLDELVASGRATFGEFPVTVEVGSGDAFRFGVEQ